MRFDMWQVLAAIALAYVVLVRPGVYDIEHVRRFEVERVYRINRLTGSVELLIDLPPQEQPTR